LTSRKNDVSQWLSPQKAARLAERTAKQAGRHRQDKLKSRLMLAGVVLLMFVTYAAWLLITARLRHNRHHHHDKNPSSHDGTNRVELFVPDRGWALAKVEFETNVPR